MGLEEATSTFGMLELPPPTAAELGDRLPGFGVRMRNFFPIQLGDYTVRKWDEVSVTIKASPGWFPAEGLR